MAVTCHKCYRIFLSDIALHTHCSAKADHPYCTDCKRLFMNDVALQEHLVAHQNRGDEGQESSLILQRVHAEFPANDPPGPIYRMIPVQRTQIAPTAHTTVPVHKDHDNIESEKCEGGDKVAYCKLCNRSWGDRAAFYQHLQASPHNWCFVCSKDFRTCHALYQHNASRVHKAADIKCPLCARLFELPSDLVRHLKTSSGDSCVNQLHSSSLSVGRRSIQEATSRATDAVEGRITNTPSPSVASNEHDDVHDHQSKYSLEKDSSQPTYFDNDDHDSELAQAELVMNILSEHGVDFDLDVDDLSKEMLLALQIAIDESLATHIQSQEETPQRGRGTESHKIGAGTVLQRQYAEFPANDPPGPIYRMLPVQCQTPLAPISNDAPTHEYVELDDYESDDDGEETYCQLCDRSWVLKAAFYQHLRSSPDHNWCFECSKDFASPQSLSQHNASPVHTAALKCPRYFKAPFDITIHHVAVEVHAPKDHSTIALSQSHSFTPVNVATTPFVTELALNRRTGKYECYLCHRGFGALCSLKAHLASPAHDAKKFKCPHYTCGRQFPIIAALIQHIENDGCGLARFRTGENDGRMKIKGKKL